jgi:hypothetical protein
MADFASIFAQWADIHRAAGFWPRPVTPNSKACHAQNWQLPDHEIDPTTLANWITSHADRGIGLLMGSPFPDGTTLGALDIDRDEYTQLGQALLRDPSCGRIGKKGAVFFVRVKGEARNPEFRVTGDSDKKWGKVAECLFAKKLCVIPPTIHPETGQPYRWIGTPLHEINFERLPIVEMTDVDK